METSITYGMEKIKLNTKEHIKILLPNKVKIQNEEKIIDKALDKPFGFISFDDFFEETNKLLVIINDATKPTPTSKILKYLLPVLSSHPDVKFLVATGAHKAPDEEELKFILGDTYKIFRRRTYIHDARKKEEMVYIGATKSGTKVKINKLVKEYNNILVIGSIEPHYFAGCTGGRKAFLPGIASFETIEMNHKYALSDSACSLVLEGNPVHEDMIDVVRLLKDFNIFSIQTVVDFENNIYAVTAGDLKESFDRAVKYVKDVYCVECKEKGNIVITVVHYPMDINLYQSQHALENGKLALEDDGVMILISKCRKGVGSESFLEMLSKADTPEGVIEAIGGKYKLESHKAFRILKIKSKAKLFAVTDLDDEIIKKAKIKPYANIQKALDDAIKLIRSKGKEPRILVIPDGSHTVPLI
jgi:nickel-dependent lactate racemase